MAGANCGPPRAEVIPGDQLHGRARDRLRQHLRPRAASGSVSPASTIVVAVIRSSGMAVESTRCAWAATARQSAPVDSAKRRKLRATGSAIEQYVRESGAAALNHCGLRPFPVTPFIPCDASSLGLSQRAWSRGPFQRASSLGLCQRALWRRAWSWLSLLKLLSKWIVKTRSLFYGNGGECQASVNNDGLQMPDAREPGESRGKGGGLGLG